MGLHNTAKLKLILYSTCQKCIEPCSSWTLSLGSMKRIDVSPSVVRAPLRVCWHCDIGGRSIHVL